MYMIQNIIALAERLGVFLHCSPVGVSFRKGMMNPDEFQVTDYASHLQLIQKQTETDEDTERETFCPS